jgi:hypothetical protein
MAQDLSYPSQTSLYDPSLAPDEPVTHEGLRKMGRTFVPLMKRKSDIEPVTTLISTDPWERDVPIYASDPFPDHFYKTDLEPSPTFWISGGDTALYRQYARNNTPPIDISMFWRHGGIMSNKPDEDMCYDSLETCKQIIRFTGDTEAESCVFMTARRPFMTATGEVNMASSGVPLAMIDDILPIYAELAWQRRKAGMLLWIAFNGSIVDRSEYVQPVCPVEYDDSFDGNLDSYYEWSDQYPDEPDTYSHHDALMDYFKDIPNDGMLVRAEDDDGTQYAGLIDFPLKVAFNYVGITDLHESEYADDDEYGYESTVAPVNERNPPNSLENVEQPTFLPSIDRVRTGTLKLVIPGMWTQCYDGREMNVTEIIESLSCARQQHYMWGNVFGAVGLPAPTITLRSELLPIPANGFLRRLVVWETNIYEWSLFTTRMYHNLQYPIYSQTNITKNLRFLGAPGWYIFARLAKSMHLHCRASDGISICKLFNYNTPDIFHPAMICKRGPYTGPCTGNHG